MKNKLPLIVSLVFLANMGWLKAQFNPESRAHLDQALEQLTQSSGVQLAYEVHQLTTNSENTISEGKLWMKGSLYRLENDEMMVLYDGVDQYIYRADDEELMIQKADTSMADESNPLSVLKSYKNGYKYDIKEENDSVIVINMISQSQFNPYLMVTVAVNKKKKEIVSLKMLLRDETALKIDLKYIEKNIKLPKLFFDFKQITVAVSDTIDLRD